MSEMEEWEWFFISIVCTLLGAFWFGLGLVDGFTMNADWFFMAGLGFGLFLLGFTHLLRTFFE